MAEGIDLGEAEEGVGAVREVGAPAARLIGIKMCYSYILKMEHLGYQLAQQYLVMHLSFGTGTHDGSRMHATLFMT